MVSTAGRTARREELLEKAAGYTLLSDVFMSVALGDAAACQHVIRVLTGKSDLVVRSVRTQYKIAGLVSHDAVLDVFAEDLTGRLYNLEIQRRDTVDHPRRVRFYTSMIDSEFLEKGHAYRELPELYVVYITETDIWRTGMTICKLERSLTGAGIPYDDGLQVLYVNAAADDGSEAAGLMRYFKTASPQDMSQGALSERVRFLKSTEEGKKEMFDKISEEIYQMGLEDGRNEGRSEGMAEGMAAGQAKALSDVASRLRSHGIADEIIADILAPAGR